jgi:hypothetical protein
MKPSPIFHPIVTQVQSVSGDFSGFIRDKFLTFAYRYRYEDGYYSSFSSWSPYTFIPGNFAVDLDTSTNLAMENVVRAYSISFKTGPRSVKDIELVFKVSNSNNVYSIIKFNKEEKGWANNTNQTFLFENYKVYNVLPESEYFRSFDNVPLTALTQARIGNRLVYGNYVEGRDIDEEINFSVDYESSPINSIDVDDEDINAVVYDDTLPLLVDFWGTSTDPSEIGSGAGIVMDFETNIATITNSTGSNKKLRIPIVIDKEPTYSLSTFDVNIYLDGTLVKTKEIPSGVDTFSFEVFEDGLGANISDTESVEVYIEAEGDSPVLFKTKATFQLQEPTSPFTIVSRKTFDTDDYYQLLSNTLNLIPKKNLLIDLSPINVSDGSTLLFDFDLRTHFNPLFEPPITNSSLFTFVYSFSSDYDDVEDFITNSNFISELEIFFDNILSEPDFLLPGSTLVSIDSLITSFDDNILEIQIPNRTISITETGSSLSETKVDFIFCNFLSINYSSTSLFTSMHSSRDYEIGIVFLDNEGRKTTVIDSATNNLYINSEDSVNQNVINVTTSGNPPSWAKYYKFAVKYNRGKYDTIFTKKIYTVDSFTYLELVGDNKNKVKDGDYLVVKSDLSGVVPEYKKVKVLDAKFYEKDEITEDSISGFFMKIKAGNLNLVLSDNDFLEFLQTGDNAYLSPYYISSAKVEQPLGTPLAFFPGNIVRFESTCNRLGGESFSNKIDAEYLLTKEYADFREVFEDVIATSEAFQKFAEEGDVKMSYEWRPTGTSRTQIAFKPETDRDGRRRIRTTTNIYVTTSSIPVFETIPLESDDNIYIETPETYSVINGEYQFETHTLTSLFNCYCFGNGVESISVRDEFTTNFLNIDYGINAVSEDKYKQVNRYADLTYSGVYQESTNVNKLNEFNLSLANYKDDLEKSFGPIVVLDSEATDLLVIQEDRFSKVLYGKDLLFNADATTNLSRIEDVLGQQVVYGGEYGISFQADSYDSYATNSFNSDIKRGAIIRLNESNGLMEISASGMRDYFKRLFRDNRIVNVIGRYDSFFDIYILNIKYAIPGKNYTGIPYDYVTWSYSPEAQGFLGMQTFNPDDMLRVNNHFLSFKGGDVYKHNVGPYSTFYGTLSPSSFEFNFNQEPSTRKIFKNISIEGNSAWNLELKTDLQDGLINLSDFKNKEGVYYGYIRGNNNLDLSTLAVSGLGVVSSITGNNVFINGDISSNISIGDLVYNQNLTLIGSITNIGSNFITLSSVVGLSVTNFILSSKPSSVETSGIRGYYMNTKANITTNQYVEVYALNSEVIKSFE